jgi:fatty-acyl-CoA synthase
MAALVLAQPDAFDGRAFYEFTAARLPSYAAPVYLRLVGQADVTTTFKLRKVDLQRDGYDPARVTDPLYVRDDRTRTYVRIVSD